MVELLTKSGSAAAFLYLRIMMSAMETFPVLATAYMPPVAFWVAAKRLAEARSGVLPLCSDECYLKQTYRNRAVILNAQGEQRLSVPVQCPRGPKTRVREVLVCYDKDWRRDHWRSLCTAYNNSPYFLYYRDELEAVLMRNRYDKLWDLNVALIGFLSKRLR